MFEVTSKIKSTPAEHLRKLVNWCLVSANVLIVAVTYYSLLNEQDQYKLQAQTLTQNTANAIDESVTGSIERIDLSVRYAIDELERQLSSGSIDAITMTEFLNRQRSRMPEVENCRIVDAEGIIRLGTNFTKADTVKVSDRDYFIYHKGHNDDVLWISHPMMGRVAQKPLIPFVRRYKDREGQFAGVVYCTVSVDYFTHLISQYDLGPKGTVILRDDELGLITRLPAIPDNPAGKIGNRLVSPELRERFNSGVSSDTFINSLGGDGIHRLVTFHRLKSAPMIVIIGVASQDYLVGWKNHATKTFGLDLAFALLSAAFAAFARRTLYSAKMADEQKEAALKEVSNSEKRYRGLVEFQNEHVVRINRNGIFTFANHAFLSAIGLSPELITGRKWQEVIHPDDIEQTKTALSRALSGPNYRAEVESRLLQIDGPHWIAWEGNGIEDELGEYFEVQAVGRDITKQKVAESSLRTAGLVYETTSEAMVVTTPDGVILAINPAFSEMTGYSKEEVIGQSTRILQSGRHDKFFYAAMWEELNATGHWKGEIWNKRKNGEIFPELLTINTVYEEDGAVAQRVALFSDISEEKRTQEVIWQHANFDTLTKLPNRRMFLERLEQEIKTSRRTGLPLALLFIDLDRFKEVNDTLGHEQGDILLQEAAKRLLNCVRETDVVGRLGGDEFTIILTGIEDQGSVDRVAELILDSIVEPFQLESTMAYVSASIGITLYPEDAADVGNLLKNSDQAMYASKKLGRNRFNYFKSTMQVAAVHRVGIANDLRAAIAEGQFKLFYQPIVDLKTGDIHKAEALIRWFHPTKGIISPAEFIPIAEETGLIIPIGDWVFKEAASQAAKWHVSHQASIQISVNKSPVQFSATKTDHSTWIAQLNALGLKGNSIAVEITEGLLMDATTSINRQLLEFSEAGIQVSIDDFGTGYSSLSYLKKFDIDFLKIDQSFVSGLTSGESDKALCEAIIVMALKLGMKVIAEGVETEEQRDFLKNANCDYGQGYLFSHPVPAEEFEKFLQHQNQ